jgi:hypothetical protein
MYLLTNYERDIAVTFNTIAFYSDIINRNTFEPRQSAQAGLDPCWSQTHYVGILL